MRSPRPAGGLVDPQRLHVVPGEDARRRIGPREHRQTEAEPVLDPVQPPGDQTLVDGDPRRPQGVEAAVDAHARREGVPRATDDADPAVSRGHEMGHGEPAATPVGAADGGHPLGDLAHRVDDHIGHRPNASPASSPPGEHQPPDIERSRSSSARPGDPAALDTTIWPGVKAAWL
jgi:hypothetical protein